jgi:hypothetical protein
MISGRKSNFGTSEMARLIPRIANYVARQYPKSVLGVGNVSIEEGGAIGQSVSHRSGRDVDLGMYALSRTGGQVNLRAFRKFEADGWDRQHRYQFDTRRNLALMVALLTDKKVEVQWVFVADWLKKRLIAEAWEQAIDPRTIARMEVVLHQPGDSNPHQDHYHVRIYCSSDDRRHGCLERGPIWEWVDLGDNAFSKYVTALVQATKIKSVVWRERVIRHLGLIRAADGIPRLLELLDDPVRRVRTSALAALKAIGEPESCPQLTEVLATVEDQRVATGLARIILTLDHPLANDVARELLRSPERVIAPSMSPTESMRRAALRRLGIHGTAQDAMLILPLLRTNDRRTRRSAITAMQRLTGTPYPGANDQRSPYAFWEKFVAQNPTQRRALWFAQSLRALGIPVSKAPDWQDVPALISALRHKNTLAAHTVSRLLTRITGHPIDPRARTSRNTQRAWRTFWRHLQEFTAAEGCQRLPRRTVELYP